MLKSCVIYVVTLCSMFNICWCYAVQSTPIVNIAVIGAGPSGLVVGKHAAEQGFNVTIFEQNDMLGGVWVYTDEIGKNKYGVNIHTSMYEGLRANVPLELLGYPDHVYPDGTEEFPDRETIWNYLDTYADQFDVKKYIKYLHMVLKVQPIQGEKWKVIVKDLANNKIEKQIFDAVVVCNGHDFAPRIPKIEGIENFKGKVMHSHDFRKAATFTGEDVLVIGNGPSGRDLVTLLSNTANRITWSQRANSKQIIDPNEIPAIVTFKDEVKRVTETGAEFVDGTQQHFTVIIYATGYNYTFPFLGSDTGITVDDNYVQPLFKHVMNIEHPSMAFLGIATGPTLPTLDLQARFILKFWSGAKKLPSKGEMLQDLQKQMAIHWKRDSRKHRSHSLGATHPEYLRQLVNLTDIEPMPKVLSGIFFENDKTRKRKPTSFRNYEYTIIDNKRFFKSILIETTNLL